MGCVFVKPNGHSEHQQAENILNISTVTMAKQEDVLLEDTKSHIISQVAKEVTDFSSQYGNENSISYTACNLAGSSSIFPNYGDFTQACVFRTYGPWWKIAPSASRKFKRTPSTFISEDYIELQFDIEVYPSRIEIYETFNPGAVVRILACDTSGTDVDSGKTRWQVLWEGKSESCEHESRKFCPTIKQANFRTNLIRLEFCHDKCDYYTELDCVYLCGHVYHLGNKKGENSVSDDATNIENTDSILGLKNLRITDIETDFNNEDEDSSDVIQETNFSTPDLVSTNENEGTPNGYFDILPEEVIQLILSYLDVPSLCRACQTSRLLHKHCYDPLQYRELDLQCHWTQVNDRSLESLHSRCRYLQRLNLSWCGGKEGGLTDNAFKRMLTFCGPELRCLYLSTCNFVNKETLEGIVECCPNLEEVDFSSCTYVDHGDFSCLSGLKKLERLNLYRTLVDLPAIAKIIESCNRIQHLNLGSCGRVNNYDETARLLSIHCKDVRSLDFWRSRTISEIGLQYLSTECKSLEELDVGWCSDLRSDTDCFINLCKACTNLKKLYFTANRTICDRDLYAIAKYCPKLEQLDILGTRQVSQEAALSEELPSIQSVKVCHCPYSCCRTEGNDSYRAPCRAKNIVANQRTVRLSLMMKLNRSQNFKQDLDYLS